jgi:peptidoglycan/LPS O-acetylase OafA/YrhL
MRLITAALLLTMFFLVSQSSGPLYAYLDPGTGSFALQFILGGLVALLAAVRVYWDRLKNFVQRRHGGDGVATGDR